MLNALEAEAEVYCGETKVLPNKSVSGVQLRRSLLRRDESTSQQIGHPCARRLKSTAERRKYFPTKHGHTQPLKEVYCGETKVLPNRPGNPPKSFRSLLRRDESTSQLTHGRSDVTRKSTAERRKYFPTLSPCTAMSTEVYCGETKVLPNLT